MLIKCFYKIFKLWPHPQNSGHSEASLTNTKNYKIFSEFYISDSSLTLLEQLFLHNSESGEHRTRTAAQSLVFEGEGGNGIG